MVIAVVQFQWYVASKRDYKIVAKYSTEILVFRKQPENDNNRVTTVSSVIPQE